MRNSQDIANCCVDVITTYIEKDKFLCRKGFHNLYTWGGLVW